MMTAFLKKTLVVTLILGCNGGGTAPIPGDTSGGPFQTSTLPSAGGQCWCGAQGGPFARDIHSVIIDYLDDAERYPCLGIVAVSMFEKDCTAKEARNYALQGLTKCRDVFGESFRKKSIVAYITRSKDGDHVSEFEPFPMKWVAVIVINNAKHPAVANPNAPLPADPISPAVEIGYLLPASEVFDKSIPLGAALDRAFSDSAPWRYDPNLRSIADRYDCAIFRHYAESLGKTTADLCASPGADESHSQAETDQ